MKFTRFQLFVHAASLLPLAVLIYDYFTNNLTFNPIQEATLRTGKTSLILLVLTLACTPLNTLFRFTQALKVRRALGLYTFMYVTLHLLIFVWADYGLVWALIKEAIFEKSYALVGFTAFLVMLPLALTSTDGWKVRLRKKWKSLHKGVYLAGILAVIHYIWLVKSDIREPLIYAAIVAVLLLLRYPPVRRWASKLDLRRFKPRRQSSNTVPSTISGGR